ncbi:MAG: type IV secretory system conjugative DNA transfer family protein, partial [Deltaproteobacteria bacterium]|nr:type IV secretory system conjugative DNA transfer family protein [Deltaproteobacteria bacterium]
MGLFKQLELLLLDIGIWLFEQDSLVAIIVLGLPAAFLLIYQTFKEDKNVWAGLIGIILVGALAFHLIPGYKASSYEYLISLKHLVLSPSTKLEPIPLLEPFFTAFVAPLNSRFVWEEIFGVILVAYLISVLWHSYESFRKTGLLVGETSFSALFGPKVKRPKRSEFNELGSADLASTEMIARWTKHSSDPATDTSIYLTDVRGSEGIAFKSTPLIWPREERNRHILIVAKTGAGKTTKLILPILYSDALSPIRSTIVIDSKPEMWAKLANLTRKYCPEKEILLFSPLDVERSLSWNILAKVEDDTDCKLIADTIVRATDLPGAKHDSPFFRNNALSVLNGIMVGLLDDQKEGKDELSMPRVHQIVHSGNKALADWLEAHPSALRFTKAFVELVRSGSQNADTVVSELAMRVNAWDIKSVQSTTWKNEIDLEVLVKKPTLFIVEFKESELEMLRPLANVIVVELMRFLTKYAEKCPKVALPRPVSLVIDEFASAIGKLPDIHVKLNTMRSRNISIVASIQSVAQIKANYDNFADSVIAGFSTKIFMPPLDLPDAEMASKDTGQMTIRYTTRSSGTNRKIIEWFASKNLNTQEQVQQRPVLTPDEIGRPADNIATIFMPNTLVFQAHLVPYYKIPEMNARISESEKAPELRLRAE